MKTSWNSCAGMGAGDDSHGIRATEPEISLKDENWLMGVDSRLLTTIKTDLMGTIGRTTR